MMTQRSTSLPDDDATSEMFQNTQHLTIRTGSRSTGKFVVVLPEPSQLFADLWCPVTSDRKHFNIVTILVTIDGVWIGNWDYWTLTHP
jgi:hypothetical protein